MASFRDVSVVGHGTSAALHVWVDAAAPVVEVFAEGLRASAVQTRRSHLRLTPVDAQADGPVVVEVQERPDGAEWADVEVPPSVADLSPEALAWLALDVVVAVTGRLGELCGWPAHVVPAARRFAIERGLAYAWDGPWKAAPSRRHEARARYRSARGEGGQVVLEVRARADGQVLSRSDPSVCDTRWWSARQSARTLRWTSGDAVQVQPRWHGGPVVLRTDEPVRPWPEPVASDESEAPGRPPVVVRLPHPEAR